MRIHRSERIAVKGDVRQPVAQVQIARGSATLNGAALNEGDGVAVSEEEIVEVRAVEDAEILLFDLA